MSTPSFSIKAKLREEYKKARIVMLLEELKHHEQIVTTIINELKSLGVTFK